MLSEASLKSTGYRRLFEQPVIYTKKNIKKMSFSIL